MSRKRSVLMLNYEFPPLGGGAGNACYYLLKEFSKDADMRIDLVTSSPGTYRKERFSRNITLYKLDVGKKDVHYWTAREIAVWTWKAYRLAKQLVDKQRYDVCHCWFGWPSGLIGYRLRAQVPYLVALRGSDVPGYNPRLRMQDLVLFGPLSRRVWQHASAVVANSAGLKELAAQTWNGTIHIIPNGVDTTEFKPARRKRSGPLRLISVGRLIRRKGYDVLIEAMAGLDAELTLVGEGPEQDKLQRLAQQHKVRVRFAGAVPHSRVAQELQKADVFVLPSRAEGMSNSVLEAMACGLPVVVSDVGGAEELVNGNGSVLEKESSDKLHQILKQYVQSRPLVNMHGEKSRDLVRSLSWEATSQCYGEMYFELA